MSSTSDNNTNDETGFQELLCSVEPLQPPLSPARRTENGQSSGNNGGGGSSLGGAIFNFTNTIVGAGAIGLGGAIADSGGLVSLTAITIFAILTKMSLDLVVMLSIEQQQQQQQQQQQHGGPNSSSSSNSSSLLSYEALGRKGLGRVGEVVILISKFFYSFGCLVAYVIVVKDNFASALLHILYSSNDADNNNSDNNGDGDDDSWFYRFLSEEESATTFVLSLGIILPLCLLRDMTPLSSLSVLSVASMMSIVLIVIYLYVTNPCDIRQEGGTTYQNWFEIRPGLLRSLGTFVFTFVSQHTVHITYSSIREEQRNLKNWKKVSFWAINISSMVSIIIGLIVYMTFWTTASSDLFDKYPSSLIIIDFAKLLLCISMLLTFPFPFFTCRELIIMNMFSNRTSTATTNNDDNDNNDDNISNNNNSNNNSSNSNNNNSGYNAATSGLDYNYNDDKREPLLKYERYNDNDGNPHNNDINSDNTGDSDNNLENDRNDSNANNDDDEDGNSVANATTTTTFTAISSCFSTLQQRTKDLFFPSSSSVTGGNNSSSHPFLPGYDNKQLVLPYHVLVTFALWLIVTILAITAPSLGDVLDLVGCATGTMIAFILPALLSFQFLGYTNLAAILLLAGGSVGSVGTYFALANLIRDI